MELAQQLGPAISLVIGLMLDPVRCDSDTQHHGRAESYAPLLITRTSIRTVATEQGMASPGYQTRQDVAV